MEWHEVHDETTRMVLATVRDFIAGEVEPVWEDLEDKAEFPHELVLKMAELGLFGLTIPEEYGGAELGTRTASLVARELAYGWPSLHLIWTANTSLAAFPIIYAGNDKQKNKYLPRLASGEILGCYALTESGAGSDAAALKTRAQKESDRWILNGTKMFITNAEQASIAVVFARTGEKKHDISAFLLESRKPGLVYPGVTVRPISKRMLKSSEFCEIVFQDVLLSENALLGEENKGFKIAMATLDGGRINIAAQAVGIAARLFDEALKYTKERTQFGRPIWDNQAVQFDFAKWYADLQAAWSLTWRASCLRDEGHPITQIASSAKLFATETAARMCWDAAGYFGAMVVAREFPWLGRVMDVLPTIIYEGASNIQKIVIARAL